MLAIILSILKIAGLLVLGILLPVLLVLLLVLLVPIRYRAELAVREADSASAGTAAAGAKTELSDLLRAKATVSWILHILALQVSYNREPDICVRIFGIRLGKRGTGKKQKKRAKGAGEEAVSTGADAEEAGIPDKEMPGKKVETATDQAEHDAEQAVEKPVETGKEAVKSAAEGAEEAAEKAVEVAEESEGQLPQAPPKSRERKKKPAPRKFQLPHPIRKMRAAFQRICDKLKAVQSKKDAFLEFINREENRRMFRLIKRQVIRFLKHILPRKLQGKVRFGFDDPYTTGQALAYISPFYGVYARKLQMIPVFEEKALEGNVRLSGRIRIGTVLAIGIRVLFDKNFRTLLKQWREK